MGAFVVFDWQRPVSLVMRGFSKMESGMKTKIVAGLAALALMTGTAFAAERAMDCCGEDCTCCDHDRSGTDRHDEHAEHGD